MIGLKIATFGFKALQDRLASQQKQVRFAAAKALTQTAKKVQERVTDEMRTKFHQPTAYTLRALYVKPATKANLTAIMGLRTDSPGKGTTWDRALGHQFSGGNRRWKRFEGALYKIGVLPGGMAAVPPQAPSWAVRVDSHGNISPGLITILLSYFQAFGEQGYKANSTLATRDKRAKRGLTKANKEGKRYKTINGVVYFVVYPGRLNTRHFKQPGIYAKRGIHGVDVAPVLLFVRRPAYQRRIDMERIAKEVVAKEFQPLFDEALADALRTAR